jgi:hypothetical protein
MAAHRYWAIRVDSMGSGVCAASTVQFLDSMGNDLTQTAGGTWFSSSDYAPGLRAEFAFDNNSATNWASAGGPPQFIGWDFGAGNDQDIVACSWTARLDNSADQSVYTGALVHSDDGVVYTSSLDFTASLPWSLGQRQQFDVPVGLNISALRQYEIDGPFEQVFASAVRQYEIDGPYEQVFVSAIRQYIIEGPPGTLPRRRQMHVL